MTTVGVQRVYLRNLHTRITNSLIIGVIIAKQSPRIFSDKKNVGGNSRAVWNFTLRDSVHDYINCTCWGSEEFIMFLSKSFNVKDVVNIIDARIEIRNVEDIGEKYRPSVTSPFNLIINEKRSTILIHGGEDYAVFLKLLHIPTKSLAGCLTLADIQNNGATFRGDFVDIMVIVKHVKPPRKITRKNDGEEKDICDLIVMDRTCSEMTITLWEEDYITRAQTWKPCQTVLFMADMRAEWSNFHKGMIASITSKTVITEDPEIRAAHELRDYAKEAPKNITAYLDKMASKIPNINLANSKIMSCQQIIDTAQKETPNSNEQHFTALVYAFVNKLDLDGFGKITSTRCGRCSSYINKLSNNTFGQCTNLECPIGSGAEHPIYNTYFDMNVHLMDHTTSLTNCRLSGKTAENVLGVTIEKFLQMSSEEKEKLKWTFLLERCLVHVMVFKCSKEFEPFISILSWRIANSEEVFENLPYY